MATDADRPQESFDRARPPTRFRWSIVAMLFGVAFVLYVDRVNLMVAVPFIKEEFGFSNLARGSVLSAFLFGYAVGLVPGGWLADRLGAHRVLTAAGLSWSVLTVLVAWIPSEGLGGGLDGERSLFLLRFLLGVCEACAFPTFGRALANWMCRGERALASGLIHSGAGFGGALTPVAIAGIITQYGWRESFLISGALTFVMAALWWLLAADDPTRHHRVSPEEVQLIAAEKEELRAAPVDLAWLARMLCSRTAWLLCASEFFYGLGGFIFLTWLYTYFMEVRQAGEIYSGFLSSMNWFAMAIGAPLGGLACDWSVRRWGSPWGRRLVPLVSITLSGCCDLVAPLIQNNTACAAVFALSAGLFYAAAAAFWSTLIDVTRRGPGLLGGLMNGIGSLGSALGTKYLARIEPSIGYDRAMQLVGLMAIVSGLIWLGIDSSRQIDTPQETVAKSAG